MGKIAEAQSGAAAAWHVVTRATGIQKVEVEDPVAATTVATATNSGDEECSCPGYVDELAYETFCFNPSATQDSSYRCVPCRTMS
jgi:hypothetical protein